MSKQKREKLTVSVTPEKPRQDQLFFQVEGKLTEEQLEAIADGLIKLTTLYTSFKEELMFKQQRDKCTADATPEKLRQEKPFVQVEGELTEAQLEVIALWKA